MQSKVQKIFCCDKILYIVVIQQPGDFLYFVNKRMLHNLWNDSQGCKNGSQSAMQIWINYSLGDTVLKEMKTGKLCGYSDVSLVLITTSGKVGIQVIGALVF